MRNLKLRTKLKIFLLILIASAIALDMRLRPIIKTIMEDKAKSVAITAIDSAVSKELGNQNFKYSDIVHIERGEEGKLLGITTNIQKINCLKSNISNAISEELRKTEMRKVKIPLGAILGTELFSGAGPIINVKIFLTGNVSTDFGSELSEAGINQTKHLISLNTDVNVAAIMPGYPVETNVKTNLTIAETVIVGEVPRVYAATEQTKKIREGKALENLSRE